MNEPATTSQLERALLEWIETAPAGFVAAGTTRGARYGLEAAAAARLEARFEDLALAIFAHQFDHVAVYRAYALARGASPSRVRTSREVPPLPVAAFKRTRVATFPPAGDRAVFATSGTSTGERGRLHLDRLELYDRSLERAFRHHVLPDGACLRMLVLAPDRSEAPESSLAYMLARVRALYGGPGSCVLVRDGRLSWNDLRRELEGARSDAAPVCLLGTTLFWAEVLDICARQRFAVELPAGSRVFETGGPKGRRRTVARRSLLAAVLRHLGIPASHVVGEYGMTEMASQLYTTSLAVPGAAPGGWSYPAWLRPRLVDAASGACVDLESARETGLLAHQDLANLCSVAHLLTADLGRPRGVSFDLVGRAPQAEARGCGLADESRRIQI